jgi:hypothetical protein
LKLCPDSAHTKNRTHPIIPWNATDWNYFLRLGFGKLQRKDIFAHTYKRKVLLMMLTVLASNTTQIPTAAPPVPYQQEQASRSLLFSSQDSSALRLEQGKHGNRKI